MSELFDDEDKALVPEEGKIIEDVEVIQNSRQRPDADARRRLENMLEEKRLRDELEDFLDF